MYLSKTHPVEKEMPHFCEASVLKFYFKRG